MKVKIAQAKGCSRLIKIEVPGEELASRLDQVYADISRHARIPGFRPGRIPRDLLETHYNAHAKEELIKRAIPEYYLKAVEQEKLAPVAPPEIDSVELKDHTLYFSARVDVVPEVKLRAWRKLRIAKKKILIHFSQIKKKFQSSLSSLQTT